MQKRLLWFHNLKPISMLRRLRFELGDLTCKQLSEVLDFDYSLLNRMERNEVKPSLQLFESLKTFLLCTLDEAQALCTGAMSDERFQALVAEARARLAAGSPVGGEHDANPNAEGGTPPAAQEAAANGRADRVQSKPVVEG